VSTAPSVLKGKTLEEIMTRWTGELDGHARDFSTIAAEIAHWDRELQENGQQVKFNFLGYFLFYSAFFLEI
jgi:nuclear pore complex protein Nup62